MRIPRSRNAGWADRHRGLAELGYVEGQNVGIEYRGGGRSNTDRLPEAGRRPGAHRQAGVIIGAGGPVSASAREPSDGNHDDSDPCFTARFRDPVKCGLVASLNRPGGIATGVRGLTLQTWRAKRLELLSQLGVRHPRRSAALVNPQRESGRGGEREGACKTGARRNRWGLSLSIRTRRRRGARHRRRVCMAADRTAGRRALGRDRLTRSSILTAREQLIALAARHADAGGLSNGASIVELPAA